MMDDTVSEISSEYLSFDGMIDDESNTCFDPIGSIHNCFVELYQIWFVVESHWKYSVCFYDNRNRQ